MQPGSLPAASGAIRRELGAVAKAAQPLVAHRSLTRPTGLGPPLHAAHHLPQKARQRAVAAGHRTQTWCRRVAQPAHGGCFQHHLVEGKVRILTCEATCGTRPRRRASPGSQKRTAMPQAADRRCAAAGSGAPRRGGTGAPGRQRLSGRPPQPRWPSPAGPRPRQSQAPAGTAAPRWRQLQWLPPCGAMLRGLGVGVGANLCSESPPVTQPCTCVPLQLAHSPHVDPLAHLSTGSSSSRLHSSAWTTFLCSSMALGRLELATAGSGEGCSNAALSSLNSDSATLLGGLGSMLASPRGKVAGEESNRQAKGTHQRALVLCCKGPRLRPSVGKLPCLLSLLHLGPVGA